jgi:lysophospholipase L1-like esterase
MRILFQGDSITNAFRKPEEINPAFQQGNGYVFLIAARLGLDAPASGHSFVNRGVSGDCVTRLLARWQEDAVALAPDVLSLLSGINDTLRVFSGQENECLSDEGFSATYRKLLLPLRETNPRIHFILLEPYLLEAGRVTKEWREHLAPRQGIVREIAGEFGATFIPLQKHFDEAVRSAPAEYWAFDGIHATHAGFQLIADAWVEAASPLLLS